MQELSLWGDVLNIGDGDFGVIHYPETGQSIRWARRNGVPLFHFADMCKGTGHSNPRSAIHLVEDEDKVKIDMRTLSAGQTAVNFSTAATGNAEAWFVNEDGFMTMGLAGRGEGPRLFRRWVIKVVIPAFRQAMQQQGSALALPNIDDLTPSTLAYLAKVGQALTTTSQALIAAREENTEQRRQLNAALPKAKFVDTYVKPTEDLTAFRTYCVQANHPERKLREHLMQSGVIYRKVIGQSWDKKAKKYYPDYEYQPHARYKLWFHAADQPDAPRGHNGQMRTTLYITAVGKVALDEWLAKHPIGGAK